jgi:outer membrane protein assembly factor BamB
MPPEGLRVYRELYDGAARGLLEDYERRSDWHSLQRVATEYFLSSAGDEAAEILGDAAFESGDYRSAVSWWRRVILEYPDSDLPRERLQRKILCSLRNLGEEREYTFERDRFLAAHPGEKENALALERFIKTLPREERAPPERSSRWGGELWEARPPSLPASKLRLSWDSWIWSRQGVDALPARQALPRRLQQNNQYLDLSTLHYPFVPLLDGDALYVSGVFSLFLLDARAGGGAVLREYKKPVPGGFNDYLERSESPLYTTTLWKKAREPLLRHSGLPDEILITHYLSDRVKQTQYLGYDITVEIPTRSLVAFDARSGKILWATGKERPKEWAGERAGAEGAARVPPEPDEVLETDDEEDEPGTFLHRRFAGGFPAAGGSPVTSSEKEFSYTSPVVVKDGLAVAGGWHQVGYVDCALRALDLNTGVLRWETLLSSSGLENTMFGELAREPFGGALCEEGGVVYYVTQLGVVAALELQTGKILWLTTYDTIEVRASMSQTAILRDLSWGANPPLILGPLLIVTPRDSEYLYALDRGVGPAGALSAGKTLWKYHGGDLRDLVGYCRGLLYFTGRDEISALDIRSMDAYGRLASAEGGDALPLKKSFRLRQDHTVTSPGALTQEGVIFSDQEGIRRADLAGLLDETKGVREESLFPGPFRPSDWGFYPGRVLAGGERILMTSRHLISSYEPEVSPKFGPK